MNEKNSNKYTTGLYTVGYITLIAATALYIFDNLWAVYPFAAGVLMTIIGRGMNLQSGDFKVRRLNIMLGVGAVSLLTATYFMFIGSDAWIICVTISAILDLYTSYRLPK